MNQNYADRMKELEGQQASHTADAKRLQAESEKAQAVHNQKMKTQNRELTDQSLVAVQAVQAGAAQRAQEDQARRAEDEERARENASIGGAKSTTTGF